MKIRFISSVVITIGMYVLANLRNAENPFWVWPVFFIMLLGLLVVPPLFSR